MLQLADKSTLKSQCVSLLQGEHHLLYRTKYRLHFTKLNLVTAHTKHKTQNTYPHYSILSNTLYLMITLSDQKT